MSAIATNLSLEQRLLAWPVRRIGIAGRSFGYRDAGSGPALALLHGIGSGSGSWLHQFETLSSEFRLIAWDAPGYGESTALAGEAPTAADYAGALAALLDALSIQRLVLVGHSLGALIAAAFAARHAARLRGLVLMNPATGYGRAEPRVRDEKLRTRLASMDGGPAGMAAKRAAQLVSASASQEARELVERGMRQLDPAGHAQAARMLANANLLEDAARYAGPALVIGSSGDTVTPEDRCRRAAAAFAGARYLSLAGPGHASYIEAPLLANAAIADFVKGLAAL